MIDNYQTLCQVSLLPMSKVVGILREWDCEFDCSASDQSLQLELMQILALNDVLDDYEKVVVDSVSFAKHYVQSVKAINSILSDEYYLDIDDCAFSHLQKTLLLCALEEEDPTSNFLIVLGSMLNVPQFEFLLTSPVMSQAFLNDLCKRMPAYIIDSTEQLLQEYGFVVPQALVLSEDIWKTVLSNCDAEALYPMKVASRKFHELVMQKTLPIESMIELAREKKYSVLYANRQSITKENYLELVKFVAYNGSLAALKVVIDIALEVHSDYDVICKREILCIVQATYNILLTFYFYERFEEYATNSQWELNARYRNYLEQGRELAKLKAELLTAKDNDMLKLLKNIDKQQHKMEESLELVRRVVIV